MNLKAYSSNLIAKIFATVKANTARLNGSVTQRFKVSDAVADDEALAKGQLSHLDKLVTEDAYGNRISILNNEITFDSATNDAHAKINMYNDGTAFEVCNPTKSSETGHKQLLYDYVGKRYTIDNNEILTQDNAFLCGYNGGGESDYWIPIAEVEFQSNNNFIKFDFMTSNGYSNNNEPSIGTVVLRSGSDDSSYDFVHPSVLQTKIGLKNIHLYSIGGDNKKKIVFVQLGAYTSFYITAFKVDAWTKFTRLHSSSQNNVGGAGRYPDSIHTIA